MFEETCEFWKLDGLTSGPGFPEGPSGPRWPASPWKPKRTSVNSKWRNDGKGGEEQSDHLSWVSSFSWKSLATTRTLEGKIHFSSWGSRIYECDVWKMTDWWSRWSCKSTWSWLSLEEYWKSAHLEQSGNVKACSGVAPFTLYPDTMAAMLDFSLKPEFIWVTRFPWQRGHETWLIIHWYKYQLLLKLTPGGLGWPGGPGCPGFPGTPGSPSKPGGPGNPCRV